MTANSDSYLQRTKSLDVQGQSAAEVTPDNDNDLEYTATALWVGTQGDLKITTISGDVVTLKNIVGWVPVFVNRVWADSTADDIVAIWQ